MTSLKSVLLVVVLGIALVSCDQRGNKDDGPGRNFTRVVRQSEIETAKEAELQEPQMDILPGKEQLLIRRLKGQEEVDLSDETNDGIEKMNRYKRSPKGLKKGGGVAKGGGGGCKKGRK